MRKRTLPSLPSALVFVCLASGSLLADTVTLKSGEKVEGRVLEETDAQVTIEVKVSASITDSRSIPKSEVQSVTKESPDKLAFQALQGLKPGAGSLPAASYAPIIKSLQDFVDKYPQSTHLAEAGQQLAAFAEEKRRVDSGEVKLQNRWLGKEEAQRERYQLNGQSILSHMQDQARRGDLTGALNSLDQMEKSYPGARALPDAIDLAKQVLPSLKANADRALQNYTFRKAETEKGLQLTSEPQRSELVAANKRVQDQADATFEASSKGGVKWPPLIPQSEKSLKAIIDKVPEEQKRLAQLPVPAMRKSIQSAESARGLLADKKFDEADTALKESMQLWSANELATRLQAEATTMKTAAAAEPAPEPAADPAAPGATPAPPSGATPSAQVTSAPAIEAGAEEEEEREILPMIVLGILAVILLLVGLNVYKKIRRKANEIIE